MQESAGNLYLNVIGPFALLDARGRDIAPRGKKARALLVLLSVAPGHKRTRQWLQAKLWSDRAPEQAAGSLRSALTEIRAALGPCSDILEATRSHIGLAGERLQITEDWPNGTTDRDVEPFEGVDVDDPEFEHHIRDLRARLCERRGDGRRAASPTGCVSPRTCSVVRIEQEIGGAPASIVAARLVQDRVLLALREIDGVDVLVGAPGMDAAIGRAGPVDVLRLKIVAVASDNETFVSCNVERGPSGRREWSDSAVAAADLEALRDSTELTRLTMTAVDELMRALAAETDPRGAEQIAWLLARSARQMTFELDRASLVEADRRLRRAYALVPRGQYLAWRAFLRNLAYFVHRDDSFLGLDASSAQLVSEAVRQAPGNALVLTIGSQLEYVHQGDLRTSLRMVRRSVEVDGGDPLGWAMLSNVLVADGRCAEGFAAAQRAVELTSRAGNCFFFEHFACMAATAMRDYEVATVHARMALMSRPDFVSTRRYEVALALQRGDSRAVERSVHAMRLHEPDFRPASLLDADYPVTTMRRLPLIDAVR